MNSTNINIFVQQPNDRSKGRSMHPRTGKDLFQFGLLFFVIGLSIWMSDEFDGPLTSPNAAIQIGTYWAMFGGGVMVLVGLILVMKLPEEPASIRTYSFASKSETAFCNKCGNPYSLRKSDSNFCPNCGNPFR